MPTVYDTIAPSREPKTMNAITRQRLCALNRRFYEKRADAFDATRRKAWPGWDRVLQALRTRSASAHRDPLRVLDVGCGNGRFAHFLAAKWNGGVRYLGVDACPALLERARRRVPRGGGLEADWRVLDILRECDERVEGGAGTGNGADEAKIALPTGPFDLVIAFVLLHHVPGEATRAALVRELHQRLGGDGLLALNIWRFGERTRFAHRVVPWADWNEGARREIDLAQLEPGDYLLRFGEESGEESDTPRYCHHCDDEEIARITSPLGVDVEFFDADGRSRDLNRYLLAWSTNR